MAEVLRLLTADPTDSKKERGAFFTPPAIAEFLVQWAVAQRPTARVLDPTCGDGVFIRAAARELKRIGCDPAELDTKVIGFDVHSDSLRRAAATLEAENLDARLTVADFYGIEPPTGMFASTGYFDAVVGNPPFVRYQVHKGAVRTRSQEAALRQGVRLSGLASSWASVLIHASAFLSPQGRLAMVLPAELLTVTYAEPVRRWLRRRFGRVRLVLFERLQFADALENVVLLLADGAGSCDAFSLYHVEDAADLRKLSTFDGQAVAFPQGDKWTHLLLKSSQRSLFNDVVAKHFVRLDHFGSPLLGTVTGANAYFTLSESERARYKLEPEVDVTRISPPGTKWLRGLSFSHGDWDNLKACGERVWMLWPQGDDPALTEGRAAYLERGLKLGIPDAYKCQVRQAWWRPPRATAPDLFFTYMSHRFPRLITNRAGTSFVNSMHGVKLREETPAGIKDGLPLAALNSVTLLGAELFGRSYGGGVLKMEPREAAILPVPSSDAVLMLAERLRLERPSLDHQLREGLWTHVLARIDQILLSDVLGLTPSDVSSLHEAARSLRSRRLARRGAE